MRTLSSEGTIARRPSLFRALGRAEPPLTIAIGGREYRRAGMLKHDSWAATAVYSGASGHRVACKFNRTHRLAVLPMAWLGRALARRERRVMEMMRGVEGAPRWSGVVTIAGVPARHAVAHDWIDGRTFKPWLPVSDEFFSRLRAIVTELHVRGIAYVDMAKWENIIVGDDGRPYLVDYQIHVRLPGVWPFRWCLRRLQEADMYYVRRHWTRARPDQLSSEERDLDRQRPLVVRIGEALGCPWRAARVLILQSFGVTVDARKNTDG